MPDITFRNVPKYGDVTIFESWPQWLKDTWLNALKAVGFVPPAAPFIPTYESADVFWPNNAGGVDGAPIDKFQLPSEDTCQVLLKKYGAARILVFPFVGLGPVISIAKVRVLQWQNGATVPGGPMARAWSLNPEDQFPGVADHACREMIKAAGAA